MPDPNRPLSAGKISALKLLKEARDDAEDAGRDRWQFAIRKEVLLAAGASVSDLRWLVSSELIEEAIEITTPDDPARVFRPAPLLAMHVGGCFLLTHGGNVYVESHLSIANGLANGDDAPRAPRRSAKRRRREQHRALKAPDAPGSNGHDSSSTSPHPEWHAIEGELYFRGEILRRRGRKAAKLEEFLLGMFDDAKWARSVSIVFPQGPIETPEQLTECIRRLNDHMLLDTLRFHAHRDGAIACWEDRARLPNPSRINQE